LIKKKKTNLVNHLKNDYCKIPANAINLSIFFCSFFGYMALQKCSSAALTNFGKSGMKGITWKPTPPLD
jgi:hypothetical protein